MPFALYSLHRVGLALAAGLSLALPASAQNLLKNSGFETGSLAPWTQGPNYSPFGEMWNVTTTTPHSGQFAATCTGDEGITQTFAPISASAITEISFWAKQDLKGAIFSGMAAGLNFTDGTSVIDSNLRPTSDYSKFDITFLAATNKTVNGFVVFGESAGEVLPRTYLDDVTITTDIAPVPEASTTVSCGLLLALGFGSVVMVARKKRSSTPSL